MARGECHNCESEDVELENYPTDHLGTERPLCEYCANLYGKYEHRNLSVCFNLLEKRIRTIVSPHKSEE